MKKGITLITMGAGNVIVLEETIKSFINSGVCNEVIYGDLLLFDEDREVIKIYEDKYNFKSVKFPFNYIFKNGFSDILNSLSEYATNDLVIYMNTSEVIEIDRGVTDIINNNPQCNCFYFDHSTDPHRWYRLYDRKELKWSGKIHEEVVGQHRPYHKPVFTMADMEKDMQDSHKAKVLNDVKEIVYFQQYLNLVNYPNEMGHTNAGWVKFSTDGYDSFASRLLKKGKRYEAFIEGNLEKYFEDVKNNPNF